MLYIPEQHKDRDDDDAAEPGVEIPRLYFHPRDLVHRTPQKHSDRYADAFVYEPENVDERQLGSLTIVGEVSNVEARPTLHIVNLIASTVKKEYYRLPRRGAKRSFEAALQKVNAALTDFTIQGFTDWLGNLDVLIVAFDGHHVHVSRIGDARALLVRDNNILEITESLGPASKKRSADAEALKSFSNVVHGALLPDDTLVLGSKTLFQHVTLEHVRTNASEKTPKSFLYEVRRSLAADPDSSPMFAVIAARVTESDTPLDEPEPEPAADFSHKEVSAVVEEDEAVDTPAATRQGPPPRAPLQRPRNWKQHIVYWLRRGWRALADASWHVWQFLKKHVGPGFAKAGIWVASVVARGWQALIEWIRSRRSGSGAEASAQAAVSDTAEGAVRTGTSFAKGTVSTLRKHATSAARSTGGFTRQLRESPILAKAVVGVALLLIVILVASLALRRRSAETELQNQQVLEQRAKIDDEIQQLEVHIIYKQYDSARRLLVSLEEQVDAYAQSPESEELVVQYRESLLDAADKIDRIVRINEPTTVVADLSSVLPEGLPQGLMGSEDTLYTYDQQGNVASVSLTSGAAEKLGGLGLTPQHGGIIPRRDTLVFYTDNGLAAMDIATSEVEQFEIDAFLQADVRDMTTYATSLYYYDLENNQILRHTLNADSITDGIAWIKLAERVDLNDVRSISIDGSVYMLFKDGRVTRYLSGFQKETITPSLSDPIEDASQIFTTEDSDQLYIVEASKQRLIITDAAGEVQVQYTGDAFTDVQDIWVQPGTQKVFVLAGTRVFELTE